VPGDARSASPLEAAWERERDTTRAVVLVGFKRQGNLGLGYLDATLERYGYSVEIVDFEDPPELILATIRRAQPVLVGFSLIFQFYVHRYEALARFLREHGSTRISRSVATFPASAPRRRWRSSLNSTASSDSRGR
jgi:hypothetical protein